MKELMFVLTVVFIVSIVEDVVEYATTDDRSPMTIHNIPDSNLHLLREPIPSVLPSLNLPDSNDL